MDDVEMDCNDPSEERHEDSTGHATFKTPMHIDRTKLHHYMMSESSGYISASSPDLNSTSGSLPCISRMTSRISGGNPEVMSNDSQLSISPEASSLNSNILRSIEASPDSGISCESLSSSIKDSFSGDLDDLLTNPTSANKRRAEPPELLSSASKLDRIPLPAYMGPKVWQSTPVIVDARKNHPTFPDSCGLQQSPTKRRKGTIRKSSRDFFQSSSGRNPSIFPKNLLGMSSTSTTEYPSFIGHESVDFLFYLGKKSNYQPVLDTILAYLNPAELCRASLVSKCWKTVIENVPNANRRRKDYVDERQQVKENPPSESVKKSEGALPFRGQLIAIQNLSRTEEVNSSPRSPPVSPSKVRFNLYLKEGRKLESGQTLVQCPQCKLPSRKETEHSARCTRRGCQYYFCVLCLCKFHGEKVCPVSSVRHRKRTTAIGSRESRRNLQRLCK